MDNLENLKSSVKRTDMDYEFPININYLEKDIIYTELALNSDLIPLLTKENKEKIINNTRGKSGNKLNDYLLFNDKLSPDDFSNLLKKCFLKRM